MGLICPAEEFEGIDLMFCVFDAAMSVSRIKREQGKGLIVQCVIVASPRGAYVKLQHYTGIIVYKITIQIST